MAPVAWMIRGPEIASCNCAYGCPCQFNALPTEGNCRAAVGMHIVEGHHDKVRLDGLRWAAIAAWPGPIHMGHGEIQPIVDARATPAQREALLRIMSGQDTDPGATFFSVFVSMCETDAIRNPVTGNPHHAKLSLRQGFEFTEAEFASGTIWSKGKLVVETHGRHAHLAQLHLTGRGIVH